MWADRAGVDMVRAREGSDPAAVVFDALAASKSRGRDTVLVDTAGRLHTRTNLMNELDKIRRVAEREVPGAPHEVLLVLDATVGQNGAGAGARVHQRRRRQRDRADQARWHGQGRRRRRDRARSEAADPLRRRRRRRSTTCCRSRPTTTSRRSSRRSGRAATSLDRLRDDAARAVSRGARRRAGPRPTRWSAPSSSSPTASSSATAGTSARASRTPKCTRSTRRASARAAARCTSRSSRAATPAGPGPCTRRDHRGRHRPRRGGDAAIPIRA